MDKNQERAPISLFPRVEPLSREYETTLQDLAVLNSKLNELKVRHPTEYYGCCAGFHQFVTGAITEHNRKGGPMKPSVRVVGKMSHGECVKYQIVYRHSAGAQETFLVAEECLCGLKPVRADERLYEPQAA